MEFKEAVKIALQSLWANKLRSILTLLGVVIGVASVIAVVTLVNGANTYVTTKFSSYGADVFTVSKMPQIITSSDDYERFQKRKDILFPDYLYVKENCRRCLGIGAQQATTGKIVRGTESVTDSSIRGYTAQMPALQNLNIVQGRGFTETDEEHASHVAIIGTDIQDHLFAGVDPIGQDLRVDGTPYTVIGISEKQGSTFGASQDNWVAVPLTAYQKSYGTEKTLTIYIKAGAAGEVLENAADEVRVLVRSRRHDTPGSPDDFELDVNNTLVGFFSTITKSFGAVAGAIALGQRYRAHPRDRHPQSPRRTTPRHPHAVPHRVRNHGSGRRSLRRRRRHRRGSSSDRAHRISLHHRPMERIRRSPHGDLHRNLLRRLSSTQGGAARSHRSVTRRLRNSLRTQFRKAALCD